ncbi:MAG: hypothetical protein JRN39_03200 [Nitrososphaerota archaeon]|nr:hypothetical protein [Nitrososphaerota archaeon]MDG6939389.1 hypothetical protein [Nitrososphaerota archaeon]
MKGGVRSAEVTFHIHATEDDGKILRALAQELGLDPLKVTRTAAEGHFGNPIAVCGVSVDGEEGETLLRTVLAKLGPGDLEELRSAPAGRLEEGKFFHVRLDKQAMVMGGVKLGYADPVKLRFRLAAGVSPV